MLRYGIEPFPIGGLSIRSQNCLNDIYREYGTRDIKTIATLGGFLIPNLFRVRNCGAKSVVELVRTGLDCGTLRKIEVDNSVKKVERSESTAGQNPIEMEPFPNLHFLNVNERRRFKACCDVLGLSYPRDVNLILRDHVQFFTEKVCSVRLRNVLKRELRSSELLWNHEGFSNLSSKGFFQIDSLRQLRGLGRKTINELLLLIIPGPGLIEDKPLPNLDFLTPRKLCGYLYEKG